MLAQYDEVINVILPTLGAERKATYSPFLPICPKTGLVLQVPVVSHDVAAGTIVYEDVDGEHIETLVTGGRCKLQWKADWAMRWKALDVDYEMSGKDLIDSVKPSGRICRILKGNPPVGFTYELFLDENGEKISKSIGNGLSVEEWLSYAPPESLAQFMFQKPKAAKRLYFDVIPRQVDDCLQHLSGYPDQEPARQNICFDEISKDPSLAIKFSQVVRKKVDSLILLVVCKLEFLNLSFKLSSSNSVFLLSQLFSSIIFCKF